MKAMISGFEPQQKSTSKKSLLLFFSTFIFTASRITSGYPLSVCGLILCKTGSNVIASLGNCSDQNIYVLYSSSTPRPVCRTSAIQHLCHRLRSRPPSECLLRWQPPPREPACRPSAPPPAASAHCTPAPLASCTFRHQHNKFLHFFYLTSFT